MPRPLRQLLFAPAAVALAAWAAGGALLFAYLPPVRAAELSVGLGLALGLVLLAARRQHAATRGEGDRLNRLIVDAAADAIVTFDHLGRVESFNAAAGRLFGYDAREVIGQDITLLIQSSNNGAVDSYLRRAVKTGGARVVHTGPSFHARHRDGRAIPIELGVSKVLDEDRHLFVQIIRDLSEREQAERQRQLQVEVARLLGGDDPIEEVGPQVLQAVGQAMGWPAGLLRLGGDSAALRVVAAWPRGAEPAGVAASARAWEGGEPCLDGGWLAWPLLIAGERLGVMSFLAAGPDKPDDAVSRSLLPVATQLAQFTRRRRDREALRRARDEAEQASRAKTEFLANVTHEVRTPLGGILGLVDLLLEGVPAERQAEYLQLIRSSAETQLALVNDLLDVAKIDAAEMSLHPTPFQPRECLEPTLRTLAVRAEQKGLSFQWLVHADVPAWLVGDPLRLQQVVTNLAGNAIKFTERGGVQVRVAIASWAGREVVLHGAVRDSGIGIAPEAQGRVFEAFFQADSTPARRHGGTGLGLAITARLVSLMGGRAWLESAVGEGSTFHFTARLLLPEGGSRPSMELTGSDSSVRVSGVALGKRVLVAEDNPVNRVLVELILQKRRHAVTFAGSGREVVEACATREFDLVLMDVQLPEMDGVEATRRLRAAGSEVPVVGLSANTSEENRRDCLEAGMRAFLTKPVQPGELLRVLDDILRG